MLVPTATVGLFGVTWPQNAHPVLLKATRTECRQHVQVTSAKKTSEQSSGRRIRRSLGAQDFFRLGDLSQVGIVNAMKCSAGGFAARTLFISAHPMDCGSGRSEEWLMVGHVRALDNGSPGIVCHLSQRHT